VEGDLGGSGTKKFPIGKFATEKHLGHLAATAEAKVRRSRESKSVGETIHLIDISRELHIQSSFSMIDWQKSAR
jgi:hypothetical protein